MKKFTKVSLIIAAVLAAVGLSFCIAGWVSGGSGALDSMNVYWDDLDHTFVSDSESGNDFEESYTGIKNLDLEVGLTEMTIQESDDDKFHVYGKNVKSSFKSEKNGDTLHIESEKNGNSWWNNGNKNKTYLTLEVPKGTVFDQAELSIGMGSLYAAPLECKELKAECGMGEVTVEGRIQGDCTVDCGMGSVSLMLDNKEADFDYKVECGIGEVEFGGSTFSGLAHSKEISNGADALMNIECGMGSVRVSYNN